MSIWIKQASTEITSLNLVDDKNNPLDAKPALPNQSFKQGSVVSYVVTVPAGAKLQKIQALSSQCTTLNIGTNNNTACSNNAIVVLEDKSKGVLSIQPNYFNMDKSYDSQIITLVNIGDGTISNLTNPLATSLPSNFTISDVSCNATGGTLTAGQSCQVKISYIPNSEYGVTYPEFTYKNSSTAPDTLKSKVTIPYSDINNTPYSILLIDPSISFLTPTDNTSVVTLTNIPGGGANNTGSSIQLGQLPTLTSPLQVGTTTATPICTANMGLQLDSSCYYPVKYTSTNVGGNTVLPFNYTIGGSINNQTASALIIWEIAASLVPDVTTVSLDASATPAIYSKTITFNNDGVLPVTISRVPTTLTNSVVNLPLGSTCKLGAVVPVGESCTYSVGYYTLEPGTITGSPTIINLGYTSSLGTESTTNVSVNWTAYSGPVGWAWVTGSSTPQAFGVYGTKGVASISNTPGARVYNGYARDKHGNLWLFGGGGFATNNTAESFLNDLWKFNPSTGEWTWVSDTNLPNPVGVYGTKGVASTSNQPGGRLYTALWIDESDNIWVFGGWGCSTSCAPSGTFMALNDLWKFNQSTGEWTWISGNNSPDNPTVPGTQGVSAPTNTPGSRYVGSYWVDKDNNLMLYGGQGFDSTVPINRTTTWGMMSDIWKFNTATNQWIWMSGSTNTNDDNINFGTLGQASAATTPGGREYCGVFWVESTGKFWSYQGNAGYISGSYGLISALYSLDFTNYWWTFINGATTRDPVGAYGTLGVYAPGNLPAGRMDSAGTQFPDLKGSLWLYGGTAGLNYELYSDLWEYSTSLNQWRVVSGSNTGNVNAVYGTQGTSAASNTPGGLDGHSMWIDESGNIWVFGGYDFLASPLNKRSTNSMWTYGSPRP